MAIMGRRKQANKRRWDILNKLREEENKPKKENKKEGKVTQEEHEEKLKILREIGLIK